MKKFLALLLSMSLIGTLLTGCGFSVGKEVPLSEVLNNESEGDTAAPEAVEEVPVEEDTSIDVEQMSAEDIINEAFAKTASSEGQFIFDMSLDMILDESGLSADEVAQLKSTMEESGVTLDANNSMNFMYIKGDLVYRVCEAASYAGGDMSVGLMGMFDETVNTESYVDAVEKLQYTRQDGGEWTVEAADDSSLDSGIFGDITDGLSNISEPKFDGKLITITADIKMDGMDAVPSSDLVDLGTESGTVPAIIVIDYDLNPVSVEFDMASLLDGEEMLGNDFASSGMDMFSFKVAKAEMKLTYTKIGGVDFTIPDDVKNSAVEEVVLDINEDYDGFSVPYTGMSDTIAELKGWDNLSEQDMWDKEFKFMFGDYNLLNSKYDYEAQLAFQNLFSIIYNGTEDDLFYCAEHFDELDNSERYAVYLISFKDLPTFKVSSLTNIVYDLNAPQELTDAYNEMKDWAKSHNLDW